MPSQMPGTVEQIHTRRRVGFFVGNSLNGKFVFRAFKAHILYYPMMKKPILAGVGVVILVAVGAWVSVRPSNNRPWVPEQAQLPRISIANNSVRIDGLRNFDYDTLGQPTTVSYEGRTYDLGLIETVWFVLAPFEPDNRGPAHSFLSFGFADSQYVSISVEARKEQGESYSILKGILKQYEIMYVIGDERDLVRLRVARGDDVYLYPIKAPKEKVRALFVEMMQRANKLRNEPEFYNTLTNNCTTNILAHVNSIASRKIPYGREVLLPGYADELAERLGLIDTDLPIDEARRKYRINDRARSAYNDERFSVKIREFK